MPRHLPPLNALRSFEATVRLDSISRAAAELNVTPGAVSRQVKALEDWLGQPLFIRQHRSLIPTPFANEYVMSITLALDTIESATRSTIAPNEALTVCSYPTFTQRWLIPRWKTFIEQNPDTDVSFVTSMSPLDGLGTDYDACFCIGTNSTDWGDLTPVRLLDIVTIPVCSPDLIKRNGGVIDVSDLSQQTLLRGAPRPKDWPRWLKAAGLASANCDKGPMFENMAFAIQAAIEGIGILIADRALVADDIRQGRLVQPFGPPRRTNHAFYFVFSTNHASESRIQAILSWIKDQTDSS